MDPRSTKEDHAYRAAKAALGTNLPDPMLGIAAWRMVATNDLPCRNRRAPWTAHRWTVQCHIPL
jgi:hypothetical protein